MPRIFVDADACPVKEETARVALRHGLPVTFVARSRMRLPAGEHLGLEVVPGDFDAADEWIAARAGPRDIVITADVPLAARCLERGALVIGPSGRPFTEDNIGDALATRGLLADLRAAGAVCGGPCAFGKRERSRFLQELDKAAGRVRRTA